MQEVFFSLLGGVRLWRRGTEVPLGPPQRRSLLALLLARPGETVTLDEAVAVLWNGRPPRSAAGQLRRHIGELRRLVEPDAGPASTDRRLVDEDGSYRLALTEDNLDLLQFRRRRERAKAEYNGDRRQRAVDEYVEGLRLWHGPAAAGIPVTIRSHPVFGALDRERLSAVAEAADMALLCGAADLILAELQRVADYHPLDETVQAKLILALQATGRRAESLDLYHRTRRLLSSELDTAPGPQLRSALQQTLAPKPSPTDDRTDFPRTPHGRSRRLSG